MASRTAVDPLTWDQRLSASNDARPTMTLWWSEQVAESFEATVEHRLVASADGDLEVILLIGGTFAANSFLIGHVGHGAIRRAGDLAAVPLQDQVRAARRLEVELGIPCARLVTAPYRDLPAPGPPGALVRTTRVLALHSTPGAMEANVRGAVRTAVKACHKSGYRVDHLDESAVLEAGALVHATQARVGAAYRTPESLLAAMLRGPSERARAYGVFLGKNLIAVAFFLYWGRHVSYLFNGYERMAGRPSPNYLAVWSAMIEAAQEGYDYLDLGYSGQPGLERSKAQWGGHVERYLTLTSVDLEA